MADTTLTRRVEIIEEQVAALSDLPPRVAGLETAITEFRAETRKEFAAVRGDIADLRGDMRALNEETRRKMHALNEETRREMGVLSAETRNEMHVLHEDLISRIALLQEGRPRPRARRHKR